MSFSEERGYKESAISLALTSSDQSAQIVYTTDFSKPSLTNGIVYTTPIQIDETTLVRAIAILGPMESSVVTHSYIFLTDIINSSQLATYITQDAIYGPQLIASFEALPVVSVVSPNIVSDTTWIEDDIETSVEMFWPDESRTGFMENCGIETWGGSPSNPKKNFRLEFKSRYGASKLDYDVFASDSYDDTRYNIQPTSKFDKLLLRAGSQDGLNGEFGKENLASFVRNRVLMDVQLAMGYPAPHGRFVHLFVNGAYAGHYHLMERSDASFFQSYYGDDKEDYEVYKSGDIWDGPFDLSSSLWMDLPSHIDMTTPQGISNTNRYIDLDQTAAYLLMMAYASGHDWSSTRNCLGGTNLTTGRGGYKFILYDIDLSIGNGGIFDPNGASDINYFNAIPFQTGPVPSVLASSLEFKYLFSDKAQCECNGDGILTPNFVDSLFARRANQVMMSLIAESARWGDYHFTFPDHTGVTEWDVNDEWTQHINDIKNNYIPARTDVMLNYFKNNDVLPNLESPVFSQKGGTFNSDLSLLLTNPNVDSEIYYTVNGEDPREVGGGLSPSAILYTGAIVLMDGTHTIRARVRHNTLPDNDIDKWSAMCPTDFYINQDYSGLVINEIHYNPNDSIVLDGSNNPIDTIDGSNFEFIEIKNCTAVSVNLKGISISGGVDHTIEISKMIEQDSFFVLANDTLLFRSKYGFSAIGQYDGNLTNGGESLLLKDPIGNLVDSLVYDDNNGWPKSADSGNFSLALKQCGFDNALPDSWGIQPNFYTPGKENFFSDLGAHLYSGIVINELHYHPPDTIIGGETVDGNLYEFIELKNISSLTIDLSRVYFSDGINYVFPNGSKIDAGDFIVLGVDSSSFFDRYSYYPFGTYSGKLSNGGETVELAVSDNVILDIVSYDDQLPWDTLADGTNANLSLALINNEIDNDVASNWATQCIRKSTPGSDNDISCHICSSSIEDLSMPNITEDQQASETIVINGQIDDGQSILFRAGQSIELVPVFDVALGAVLEMIIGPCD